MKRKAIIIRAAIAAAVAVAAIFAAVIVRRCSAAGEPTGGVELRSATIAEIKPIVELATVEFDDQVPVRGHYGPKHLFARMNMTGEISFDLEKIVQQWHGDTLTVTLPEPDVVVRESTAPGSYEVIDTWDDRLLAPLMPNSGLTAAEENAIKAKAVVMRRNAIIASGLPAKARAEAATTLQAVLPSLTGASVVEIN